MIRMIFNFIGCEATAFAVRSNMGADLSDWTKKGTDLFSAT